MKLIRVEEPDKDSKQRRRKTSHSRLVQGTNIKISISSKDFIKKTPKGTTAITAIEDRSFNRYTLDQLEEKMLNKDNIWAIYKFGPSDWKLLYKNRQHYEGFACGYLQYYDTEVRNGMINHEVYFHWGNWDGQKEKCVVIFLYPGPQTKALKISKNADRIGNKYYGAIEEVEPPLLKASDPPKVPPPPPPY